MAGEAYEYEEDVQPANKELEKKEEEKKNELEKKDEKSVKPTDEKVEEGDELSETEQAAYAQGWRPEDEWKGDPAKWVDAKEFVFRGELMERIQKQTKVINNLQSTQDELKDALKVLGEHNHQIAQKEYDRALSTLRRERREALREDDHDKVDELEDRIDELKDAKDELKEETKKEPEKGTDKEEKTTELPPIVGEWLVANQKWYDSDEIMRGAADTIFLNYMGKNPEDFDGALKVVDEKMRSRFPEEFGLSKKPKASSVSESNGRAKGSKKSTKSNKFTSRDLTEEQHKIAKTFVDSGVFENMQEYVDQLADLGELDAQQ